ncbi:MAG TPA: hypothetical protein VEJ41_08870, partial [Candidatus Acidoferrales bacterium]|nr:hypothetical protein [Candidatus Acidoferrales bacterium]
TVVSHFAGDERIAAWLLTNEWPLFAGQTDHATSGRWARRLIAVVRAADPECNVSIGDGTWDVIGGQTGVPSSPELRDSVDFFGPHFYPKETDAIRHTAFAGFAMKMLHPLARPVLLEEFGCSSDQVDDELGAGYYRTTLWSAFGSRNIGTLVWNSHDFTCADRAPYSHHPYELHFGLIRTDGSRKPQADEFARFAAIAKSHDPDVWQPASPNVSIGRSAYYLRDFPFDWGWSKPQMRDLLLQTYTTCAQAGLDVAFVDLASLRSEKPQTLFVPCLWQVTNDDVRQLERFVRDGGTVYLSYGGEPWFPDLGGFVGARLLIRYGLVEDPQTDRVQMRFAREYGGLAAGTSLAFDVVGEARQCAPVRCIPTHATVIATDDCENPILLERQAGSGRVIFFTHPVEYYHLHEIDSNRDSDLRLLYRAIAQRAGALAPFCDHHPAVQTFVWSDRRNARLQRVLLVNHAWHEVTVGLRGNPRMRDVESGKPVGGGIELGEKGFRLLETIPGA